MSNAALTWAWRQPLKASDGKLVLVALADLADEDLYCFPGQPRLAEMTGQSVRTVQIHIERLEELGLVKSETRHRENGSRRSDGYRLVGMNQSEDSAYCHPEESAHCEDQHEDSASCPPEDSSQWPNQSADSAGQYADSASQSEESAPLDPSEIPPSKTPQKERGVQGGKRRKKKNEHAFDPQTVELPPAFDRERFVEFCEQRLARSAPMTETALRRFLKKHGNHDKAVLDRMFDNALVSGKWLDLYELKPWELDALGGSSRRSGAGPPGESEQERKLRAIREKRAQDERSRRESEDET